MLLISYFPGLDLFPLILIATGVILIGGVYVIYHYRKKRGETGKAEKSTVESEETENSHFIQPDPAAMQKRETGEPVRRYRPDFRTLDRRSSLFTDLLRVMLIPLSLVVAAGLILILLPQSTTDKLAKELQLRSTASGVGEIAFLYLGHQLNNRELIIRGVIRNITADPIEQLDAAVRLYSSDGDLLETAIVRMDKEIIGPDEIARFELVYPEYRSKFSSYSVEFKLRKGEVVPYEDMRRQPDAVLQ